MSTTTVVGEIRLTRVSPEYWQVTFDLPPLNIFGPANIPQLEEVVSLIETDERVKVVVFDSAIDGFFLIHYDFLAKPEESAKFPLGRTGLQALPDMLVRISRAPVVSITLIRGRATGVGSELALACDMRFASREKALLSQWEVGAGLVPGGGPMARLPRLLGRGRALEVLLTAHEFNGDLAELYGIAVCPMRCSMILSTGLHSGSLHSTRKPSRTQNGWWTSRVSRQIRKSRPNGMPS